MVEQTKKIQTKSTWNHEKWVSILGKWMWVILLVNALIYVLLNIYWMSAAYTAWNDLKLYYESYGVPFTATFAIDASWIWGIVSAIILIIFAIAIVRPRFSKPCGEKDWDYLLDDVLKLGSIRFPWMLVWGIIAEIFGQWWAGAPIILIALVLLFAGPKPYNWKT
ncbi:MAG: hypothetical protein JW891_10985 [Candidatus Lokiarchaeota archaeon]|nr:hypothetical protein [Candidatus Lokiarchaeota archaeon]